MFLLQRYISLCIQEQVGYIAALPTEKRRAAYHGGIICA